MTGRLDRGVFVTLEGGDGAGKTTQSNMLANWLGEQGHNVTQTREPGGTDVGSVIRQLLLHHPGPIDARAEALLYAADRAHHVATVVRPALAEGRIVVQDRFIDSSVAYQGSGRVLGADEVRELSNWAAGGLRPDLTVLLDLDRGLARGRLDAASQTFDRLEAEKDDFHERVRRSFLDMARAEPDRFLLLDAASPAEVIAQEIRVRVTALLEMRVDV